ncbi:thiolase family protein [Micromonospora sp. WMMD975]|uniref:thiolase family protein n=1 Tax=Micromonospora sp. WMMD975 TaxID=3016087 RepID=UPI00249C3896|nr:thiolase family protein [Micromonospora sp. WMMD975]WFE34618.1 thiolase family protein [Micromonospora sp. WMMD975]
MTRQVHVISAAMIRMGRYRDSSYTGLAAPPTITALRDSGLPTDRIGAVYCGHAFGGMLTGQRIVKEAGLAGIPVVNVDNACSGGATAVHLAAEAIARGAQETALVIGVDKITQFGGGTLPLVAEDWEVQQGMVMPALYAMRAGRYLHDRGGTTADLATVSVKNRRHGSKNPYAQYQAEVTAEEVLASRPIAEPLTLLQCCPTGDGAAALVLVADEVWRELDRPPSIRVAASVLHSGGFEPGFRDMTRPEISYGSAREAYEQASIGPADLDMIELHDAFTVAELVYYEALGLCAPGEAIELLRSGATTYGGQVVVNPSGGLLAKGHPVGASGVAQVAEAFWQLTDRAGARQVPGARTALTHVTGGGIAGLDHGACAVHIFEAAQ